MKIGVISDTHGFLDPKILKLFTGASHILHAGDIGPDSIIAELEAIAPVTAVLGNTDSSSLFPLTQTTVLAGRKFLIHHIVDPQALREDLRRRIEHERPDLVVYGHTHRSYWGTVNGVQYLNPGYAGKPKGGTQRSIAILHLAGNEIRPEFQTL